MARVAKNMKFEDALLRLEDIVSKMEDNETSLEETFKLYKEGVELYEICSKNLVNIEKEVTVLLEKSKGVFKEELFEGIAVGDDMEE